MTAERVSDPPAGHIQAAEQYKEAERGHKHRCLPRARTRRGELVGHYYVRFCAARFSRNDTARTKNKRWQRFDIHSCESLSVPLRQLAESELRR